MYSKHLICQVKNLNASGQSIKFISQNFELARPTVIYVVKNNYNNLIMLKELVQYNNIDRLVTMFTINSFFGHIYQGR